MSVLPQFLKKILLFIAFFFVSKNVLQAQCVQIESILVAACGTPEGHNEMFRFRVGPTAVNTNVLTVNWPSNTWEGLVQNAGTAAKVSSLNADILAAGGCAELLEPVGGVLPANAPVIVVTSYQFDTTANSFGALTEDTYILFQNSTATGGHFGNYAATGTRTLSISFGGGCNESVTYTRNLLSQSPGATVNFTAAGVASYINNGCSAPVQPFTVDAGPVSMTACAGAVLNFTGMAEGYQTVEWNATQGNFSSTNTLVTTFTVPSTASGTIAVTLTATNSCGATITDAITLLINAATTPIFSIDNDLCNGEAAPLLPNLSDNGISGTWSPNTVSSTTSGSYIFTPDATQCSIPYTLTVTVTNGTITPTFTPISPICLGETISPLPTTSQNGITGTWAPALDNTTTTTYTFTPDNGQCANTQTLTIVVNNTIITPTFATINPICEGENITPLPTISNEGITGTWSPALDNSTTTTYTFTPNPNQCAIETTLSITVIPTLNPIFASIPAICPGESLAPLPTTSQNGITGSWTPALNNNVTTTYTFTPDSGQCATLANLTITVNDIVTPIFDSLNPICEGDNLNPLPTISNNGITGTWAPALDNTTTTTYTFTPDSGQCANTQTLTIVVNNAGTMTPIIGSDSVCIGDTLALSNTTAGGDWISSDINVATVDNDGLVNPVGPGYATISYITSACTYTTLDITVYLPPNPLLTDRYICVDKVTGEYLTTVNMQCGVSNADHTFEWTLNGQPLPTINNLHVATEEGLYEVTVTNTITGCTSIASANVIKSSIAIAEASVEEDFQRNQIITVTVTGGSGDYEYQLDNNWPQDSNQFVVEQGEYEITIIDKNGCGVQNLTVFALNYPRYFTPNNDGYNDTWLIEGLSNQQMAQVYIFDRYGKLIKAIKPYLNEAWDGTLNGYPLPATDYWFTLNYITKQGLPREFKSHFSLKR